ncbi:MAG: hypothetical protein P8N52_07895 [Crocinitomicaceae bacterium]|nr:hypothetical protein [Crocinitomicaceae bacterium]MDG1775874.1 hypothetical protein [Crocinitomicaceae bacterium]
MRALKQLVIYCLGACLITSCKPDEPEEITPPCPDLLSVTVQPVFGGETLYLDSSYQTPEGYDIQFTDIKFYLQDVRNGLNLFKDAALFDYRLRGTNLMERVGDKNDYVSLQSNLGVSALVNHNDPVGFDPASWLYISNSNDMHWDWNPGYIFVKIEAKVDTIQDGNSLFDHNVVYHVGKDENLKTLSFTDINWVDIGSGYVLPLKLDMFHFLNVGASPIDVKTAFTSHSLAGQEGLSEQIISNFQESLTPF